MAIPSILICKTKHTVKTEKYKQLIPLVCFCPEWTLEINVIICQKEETRPDRSGLQNNNPD